MISNGWKLNTKIRNSEKDDGGLNEWLCNWWIFRECLNADVMLCLANERMKFVAVTKGFAVEKARQPANIVSVESSALFLGNSEHSGDRYVIMIR